MDLSRIILGPVVTEKAERQKTSDRTYTMHVANDATKIDVKNALKKYYDLDATSVRVMRTTSKVRAFGSRGKTLTKRKPYKKVMVTLGEKSKPLDITSFKS